MPTSNCTYILQASTNLCPKFGAGFDIEKRVHCVFTQKYNFDVNFSWIVNTKLVTVTAFEKKHIVVIFVFPFVGIFIVIFLSEWTSVGKLEKIYRFIISPKHNRCTRGQKSKQTNYNNRHKHTHTWLPPSQSSCA